MSMTILRLRNTELIHRRAILPPANVHIAFDADGISEPVDAATLAECVTIPGFYPHEDNGAVDDWVRDDAAEGVAASLSQANVTDNVTDADNSAEVSGAPETTVASDRMDARSGSESPGNPPDPVVLAPDTDAGLHADTPDAEDALLAELTRQLETISGDGTGDDVEVSVKPRGKG